MPSATQVYSIPAQLGRRGNTALVVIGIHVVIALGLIAATTLVPFPRKDDPPSVTWVPPKPLPPPTRSAAGPEDTGYHLPAIPTPETPPDLQPPSQEQVAVSPDPVAQPVPNAEPARLTNARIVNRVEPVYSAAMIRANERGSVIVRVQVGVNGRPERVEIATPSGFPRLDEAAIAAVRHWMFAPAQTAAGPIESWVTFRVTFKLVD